MEKCGVLMSQLLRERRNFESEEDFRGFITQEINQLAKDLRQFEIEVSVRPGTLNTRRRHHSDWNSLHMGCE